MHPTIREYRRIVMNCGALSACSVSGSLLIILIVVISASSKDKPKQVVSPPSMTKLAEPIVMAPLPDGRLIAVVEHGGAKGPAPEALYSSNGGRTWSPPEKLFTVAQDTGNWGLHNVLVDHGGELHLFY